MDKKDKIKETNLQNLKMSFSYAKNFHLTPLDTKNMFMAKKAHKIMTAIYLISEQLPENEPLKNKIRRSNINLVSSLFSALSDSQKEKPKNISKGQNLLEQIICLLETMKFIGYISEMNYNILISECHKLQDKLSEYLDQVVLLQRSPSSNINIEEIGLERDFFGSDDSSIIQKSSYLTNKIKKEEEKKDQVSHEKYPKTEVKTEENVNSEGFIKDSIKRTVSKGQISIKDKALKRQFVNKKHFRQEEIIDILKDNRNMGIAEICSILTNYGPKTIQRDLKNLIEKGLVVKKGERRWSSYSLFIN